MAALAWGVVARAADGTLRRSKGTRGGGAVPWASGAGWGSVGGLVPSQGQCGCLHVPLELVSGPGTCGWAAFCWLDRNFEVPGAFSAPQSAPLTQSSKRRLVGREHALPTLKCQCPCPPPSTRASTFSGFAQPPYNRATPALAFPRLAQPYTPAKRCYAQNPSFFAAGGPRALQRGRRGNPTGGAAGPPSNLREKTPSAHLERVFWIDLAP